MREYEKRALSLLDLLLDVLCEIDVKGPNAELLIKAKDLAAKTREVIVIEDPGEDGVGEDSNDESN